MPTGERPPDSFVHEIVEYLVDVYTEAIRPLFPMVFSALLVYCVVRIAMRVHKLRSERDQFSRPAIPERPG